MLKTLLVDTNVLIDYSKGKSQLLGEHLASKDWQLAVNPVIVAEFVNDKQLVNQEKKKQAKEFIGLFSHIDLNKKIGGRRITDVWSDWQKTVKKPPFKDFQKLINKDCQYLMRMAKEFYIQEKTVFRGCSLIVSWILTRTGTA